MTFPKVTSGLDVGEGRFSVLEDDEGEVIE